ncbi:sugar nucleotide-binding protein [Pleionea sediminis]|uniref:sugar nucleotide-binding protein n=1 Tax=Pleionea sediminis TaxID=2569479 RepID=UPI001184A203|nr:sugar nucleotide-binding protein [Pleionea sediminis]
MSRILLAGYGALAQQLAALRIAKKDDVIGIKRQKIDSKIPLIYLDLSITKQLTAIPDRLDYVVITLSPDEMTDESYQKHYYESVNNLMRYLSKQETQPYVIYVSSTRVYGQCKGEWIDEESETQPTSRKGQILLETENLLSTYENSTIVRFSGIYGNTRDRLIKKIQKGSGLQATPKLYTNRIHEDDCVGILSFLIDEHANQKELKSLYLCSDHSPTPLYEVGKWIAKQYKVPTPKVLQLETNNQGKRCRNQKILQQGYRFKYPTFKEGYLA